jgi:hypothetical protein
MRLQELQLSACSAAGARGSQFRGDLQRAQVVLAPILWSYVLEWAERAHSELAWRNSAAVAILPPEGVG